ncbi:MAG: toxin-antitoxin system antitoxin subunit [Coriobacteriia bacterium]|nr:toxin-antitoxin system antitoxin subunit [Coriobacteriia bacterium]
MSTEKLHKKFGVDREQLEEWASEYESESWSDMSFGQITQGRPRISREELKPITVKVPASRLLAIQQVISNKGMTQSEFLRQAIDHEIIALS